MSVNVSNQRAAFANGPAKRLRNDSFEYLAELIQRSAARVSRNEIGWRKPQCLGKSCSLLRADLDHRRKLSAFTANQFLISRQARCFVLRKLSTALAAFFPLRQIAG